MACGDNTLPDGVPLSRSASLTIVAHEDDDLLFMQPDLYEAVQGGAGVTTVYVTAGNSTHGVDYAESREQGLLAAYAEIAGANSWSCGWIELSGHAAEHCRLDVANLSLVFLGYPDGLQEGQAKASLLHLWEGTIDHATTIGRKNTTYDQNGLITTLAGVIDTVQPKLVRTLEIAATHGYDHSDHMLVGALALLATAASKQHPAMFSYRGYDATGEPETGDDALFARSADAFLHYQSCATGCARCGQACPSIDDEDALRLHRRYAVGMEQRGGGPLQLAGQCVLTPSATGNAVMGDCAGAPTWQVDVDGNLRSNADVCLDVLATGEIAAGSCAAGDPGRRWFFDDEGHLWTGVAPAAQADMDFAHLYCLRVVDGQPRTGLCGQDSALVWNAARAMTVTPRAGLSITCTGRAVRLGDLVHGDQVADLCAVETAGLMCAPGTADGGLQPAVRIDDPAAPLTIEPESLVIGDIDGDGHMDACGRDAGGILCATFATGYKAQRFSAAFALDGPAAASDRSLSVVDGQICGLTAAGIVCVSRGAAEEVRSSWPDPQAPVWGIELDGDHEPDWCVSTPQGLACGLGAEREVTTTGDPWGYAFGGIAEGSTADGGPVDTASAAFADINGDGRGDVCLVRGGLIVCAQSQGHGFGPRAPFAQLPAGMVPTGIWATSQASQPRVCAGDDNQIVCTP
jgi:LmbE family N-acetylglucosaminyl deacetylase